MPPIADTLWLRCNYLVFSACPSRLSSCSDSVCIMSGLRYMRFGGGTRLATAMRTRRFHLFMTTTLRGMCHTVAPRQPSGGVAWPRARRGRVEVVSVRGGETRDVSGERIGPSAPARNRAHPPVRRRLLPGCRTSTPYHKSRSSMGMTRRRRRSRRLQRSVLLAPPTRLRVALIAPPASCPSHALEPPARQTAQGVTPQAIVQVYP